MSYWRNSTARQQEPSNGYRSRGEGEAAAMAMLILAGLGIEEINALFDQWRLGHYAGKRGRHKAGYLALTYRNVLSELASTPERMELAELYKQTAGWGCPGRGGGLNRSTYLALLSVAWQFASYQVYASQRDLAEHAAVPNQRVHDALQRLKKPELITQLAQSVGTNATLLRSKNLRKYALLSLNVS